MPFPVLDTGDAFHVAFEWTDGTQTAINTMSFAVDAGGTDVDLATALDTQWIPQMHSDVADSARVVQYDITPYDGVSAATPHITDVTKWKGGTGGAWVPQVAIVVSLHSATASRRARGRNFLPFITEGSITDGFTSSGNTAPTQAAWNTFLSAMGDDGFTPIIASTILAHTTTVHNIDGSVTTGVPVAGALTPTSFPITRATVRDKLATQRRRQSRL